MTDRTERLLTDRITSVVGGDRCVSSAAVDRECGCVPRSSVLTATTKGRSIQERSQYESFRNTSRRLGGVVIGHCLMSHVFELIVAQVRRRSFLVSFKCPCHHEVFAHLTRRAERQ